MSVTDLLGELERRDIKLWRDGATLKFDAPSGALDDHLREQIKALKPDLLRTLAPREAGADESGLSLGQQRMWFHEKILAGGGSYQIPGAMRVGGPLDLGTLENALRILIQRHDALRLAIVEQDGKPVAQYVENPPFDLQVVDLENLNPSAEDLKSLLRDFLSEPFFLDLAPLMKCRVFRLDSQTHVLATSLHHIISDGWSVALFVNDLLQVYGEISAGKPPGAIARQADYRDFVRENARRLASRKNSLSSFWKAYLEGAPLQFDFPSDRTRPAVENDAGNEISSPLDKNMMRQLDSLARESNCTLFTVLLAAFAALLGRLSGCGDLVIGIAHAGRNDPAWNSVIGLFANTFPIRCQPDLEMSFRELLAHTRKQSLEAMNHCDAPFDWIVGAVNPPRDLSRPPVYQVMFNFLNQAKPNLSLPGCELEMLPLENHSSKVDLTLAVEERDGDYSAGIEYKTDLFDGERMEALLGHYSVLLESIVANPDAKMGDLEILTEKDREVILRQWNASAADFDRSQTLVGALDGNGAEDASVAFVCGSASLNYGDLRAQSRRIAGKLVADGCGDGVVVAVMLERGLHYPATVFGVMRAGAAFLPIAPDCPLDRLAFILADSGAKQIIISRRMAGTLGDLGVRASFVEDWLDDSQQQPSSEFPEIQTDQLAYCVYTSGTTGHPKGVEITHTAAINLMNALASEPGFSSADSMLGIAPFYFDMSIPDIFLPVFTGGTAVILDESASKSPQSLNAIIKDQTNPVMQATASTLRMLVGQGWEIPPQLRIWCGGEAFPADLAQELLGKCAELVNIYGPTEATVWASAQRLDKLASPLPVGRPLQNTRLYVLDSKLEPMPAGYPGQLYIGGEGLARGYRNHPDLTAEKFISHSIPGIGEERLYATGDLARWRFDGTLEILGRIDAQLKILGHRIEPAEIESVLTACPSVDEAAVGTAKDRSGELQLAAFLVGQREIDLDQVRAGLRQKLPAYMEPRWICQIDTLPRSPNGKLDRQALPAPSSETNPPAVDDAPLSGIEEKIHSVWSETLQVDRIGREQNFFEIGGHSLLAVHLLAEIRKACGLSVPIITFLRDPTIAGLSRGSSPADSASARLIELSPGHTSLILIPGASGNPYSYQAIAEALAPDIGLVGIAPPDHPGGDATSIEEVARDYVALLMEDGLRVPCHLAGHSYGAAVAFEMARQLIDQGQPVASLTLIDLPARPFLELAKQGSDAEMLAEIAEAAQIFSGVEIEQPQTSFEGLSSAAAKKQLLDILEQSGMIPSQDDTSLGDILLSRYHNSRHAMQEYLPGTINALIHVIRCGDGDSANSLPDSLGWDKFTTVGVRTARVSGSHISMITKPHAKELAQELRISVSPTL